MSKFIQKNANRKAGRKAALDAGESRATLKDARAVRRMLGGKFGKEGVDYFNYAATGTTATERAKPRRVK